MFGFYSDISYFCSLLQSFAEYYRLLQNIIVEYKEDRLWEE